MQVLAAALNAFSQGIAYWHAGFERLRSKSMDRNSFDSGDWFNRVDWTGGDSFFGTGLPPAPGNAASWPLMRPRLADPRLKPSAADIEWTRAAFLDLMRIRSSSTLFRLRSSADVHAVIYAIEMQFGQDINQDGEIGAPVPEENVKVQIERVNENGIVEGTFSKLPFRRAQITAFAYRVLEQGETTAMRTWVGPLNTFTREEYDLLVTWLDNQGGVDWKSEHDHRVGWKLSDDGRDILRKFL